MKLEVQNKSENVLIQNEIISKIRDLINYKNLEPGDKLPSERVLAERFNVSRRNVKEAIAKLEFYELVKSIPQSGTFIADIGQVALNGIINDLLGLEEHNFESLVETRINLEFKIAALAAERRTSEDLARIERKLDNYKLKAISGDDPIQEDLLFHLAIAKACGNVTMNTILLQITPKLLSVFEQNRMKKLNDPNFKTSKGPINMMEIQRHVDIFEAIKVQSPSQATQAMAKHFKREIDNLEK